jgi:hypothetical protein
MAGVRSRQDRSLSPALLGPFYLPSERMCLASSALSAPCQTVSKQAL